MRRGFLIAGPLAALIAAGIAWGPVCAQQRTTVETLEIIEVPDTVPAATSLSPGVVPASLQADDIVATQVKAQTIYANKIKAASVEGTIHQTKGVKIKHTKGDLKVPSVQAGIIYADEIKANSVVADNIYVRDIDRK